MHLVHTDIIPLVCQFWGQAFCDIEANRRATSERGWGPYNHNLFLHPFIRASDIFPCNCLSHLHRIYFIDKGNVNVSIVHAKSGIVEEFAINLNGGGMLMRVTNTIVSDYNTQKAREIRIQK